MHKLKEKALISSARIVEIRWSADEGFIPEYKGKGKGDSGIKGMESI